MPLKKPINLLSSYHSYAPQLLLIEQKVRRFSLIFLTLVISNGLIIGLVFIVLTQMASRLEDERFAATKQLTSLSSIESIYLAIGTRVARLNAILLQQNDWGDLLTFISTVIPKELWLELTASEDQKVTLTFKMDSLASARELVDKLAVAAQTKAKIRRPQLVNVFIPALGGVEVSISFIPVFTANL